MSAKKVLSDPTYKPKTPETLDECVGLYGDCLPAVPDHVLQKFLEDNKNDIYNMAKYNMETVKNSVLGREIQRRGWSFDFLAA